MKTELCSRHKGWIFASVAAIKYINSDVCFQFLQTRSWKRLREGEQGVENTSTCLICVGRYCHTAATGSLWEVPSCYRILLPMQITEFVKYYYKIVNWLCWEVLCLSSKAVFLWLSNDFQTVSVCLAEMSTDLSHLCVQCVAILFAELAAVEQVCSWLHMELCRRPHFDPFQGKNICHWKFWIAGERKGGRSTGIQN